jgi:hypothetical protein
VIAAYYDFVSMRERGEPIDLSLDFFNSPLICKVACMNEKIADRNCGLMAVRVGNADDTDWGFVLWWFEGRSAEEEQDVVDGFDE